MPIAMFLVVHIHASFRIIVENENTPCGVELRNRGRSLEELIGCMDPSNWDRTGQYP